MITEWSQDVNYGGVCETCGCPMWRQLKSNGRTKPDYLGDEWVMRQSPGMCKKCYEVLRRSSGWKYYLADKKREREEETARRIAEAEAAQKEAQEERANREAAFAEDVHFLRELNMSRAAIADRLGMDLRTFNRVLLSRDIDLVTTAEKPVWDWIVAYYERGIEFTTESLPFLDDSDEQNSTHKTMIRAAIRKGMLVDTGMKKKDVIDNTRSGQRIVYRSTKVPT